MRGRPAVPERGFTRMKIVTNLPEIDAVVKGFDIRNAICIEIGDTIHFSGLTGLDMATGQVSVGSIGKHANDVLDCYAYILQNIGLSLDHVIKVNAYLVDPAADFAEWNETFKARFSAPYPCRTTVGASLVAGRIELEIIAARTPRSAATIIKPACPGLRLSQRPE
jgi:2-iminobutanoate/2-iminopropanoate deaminase